MTPHDAYGRLVADFEAKEQRQRLERRALVALVSAVAFAVALLAAVLS
jgi:hypothetical protein